MSARRRASTYVVRHEIGRGGMGIVYLADDTRLSRRVALKALAPEVGRDRRRRERLRQEARAAAALSHPNIATVYALEEIGDELYLVCEHVSGPTLRALIESIGIGRPHGEREGAGNGRRPEARNFYNSARERLLERMTGRSRRRIWVLVVRKYYIRAGQQVCDPQT